jgi:DNA-binding transcriptional LysR family regulator
MLNLSDVALFVQVVGEGSFSGAARRLGMPANTVSRRIQDLETRIGLRLLQRSTRKLALTDAGRRLYDRCSAPIDAVSRSVQELVDDSATPSGGLRIAAPVDFLDSFRMEWIAEFLAAFPRVRLDFLLEDARTDLVANGVDLAFRGGVQTEPNLVVRQIGTVRRILVASPVYLAARGRPETIDALADHDCVMQSTQSPRPSWRLCGPDGPVEVGIGGRFSVNSMRGMANAAVAGVGIALLPTVTTRPHVQAGRLEVVLPDFASEQIGIHFVYVSRRQQPKAARAFMDFAEQKMRDHWLAPLESVD